MKNLQESKATQETKELLESLNITGDDAVMYRFDSAESLLDFLEGDDEDEEGARAMGDKNAIAMKVSVKACI